MADPEDPPQPQASSTPPADPPHPRGRFFTLSKSAKRDILHGSIVAIILFLIFFCYFYFRIVIKPHSYEWYWDEASGGYYRTAERVLLAIQIVSFLAIVCLSVWGPSRRTTEKIVSRAILGAVSVISADFILISITARGVKNGTMFVANLVAISSYCIWRIYPVAVPWLHHCIWKKLYLIARPSIEYCISKLHPIAQPWLKHLPWNSTTLLLHGLIIAILLFHCICALLYRNLAMQIVAYPAIACLHIGATSGLTETIVSGSLLGALALIVIFVSIGTHELHITIMFTANIVALSSYCIFKLYLVTKPWLQYCISKLYPIAQPWLQHLAAAWQEGEETGLLAPLQTRTFHIQDLPRRFSPGEVRAMTQGFQTMVGQGGFAQVFRGLLDDDTAVAVKRIATAGAADHPVGEDDFLREISIVATVHHRSLVRLLGYCLQRGGDRYLVYPFFENGSLDSWLFHGGEARRRLLPWQTRRCIAVDVAKALAYLHHECHQQILHLDIKPGNILLDGDLRAHVSDFGISMSITRDLTNVDTRGRGTPGYMAPEMMINAVSAKSDVFSYGMTLLELVGGRRNFEQHSSADASSATPDFARDFFPYIVRQKMERGELMEAVDAAMAPVDQEEVEAVVKVALLCIQSQWDMRPSMLTVVDMLEGRVTTDLPPENRLPSSVNFDDLLSSSLTHGR